MPILVSGGVLGCGPTVVLPGESGGGSGSAATVDDTGASTAASGSDGLADSTSSGGLGDPSGPCPEPIPGVAMLWCGQLDPEGPVASDGTWAYFDIADESLWRVPIVGGEAQGLAGGLGDLAALEVVDGQVYFVSFFAGLAGSVPVAGGPVRLLSESLFKPSSLAVGDGSVFVTQYGEGLSLVRYSIETGEAEELYPGLDYAGLVLVTGTGLWFATSTNDGNVPTPVWRGNTFGGPLQQVIAPSVVIEDLWTEWGELWWLRYLSDDSGVMLTELSDPPVDQTLHQADAHPRYLAVTDARIYWSEHTYNGDAPYEERIRSIARDGSDPQLHVVADQVGPVVATPAGSIVSTIVVTDPDLGVDRGAVIRLDP